ncbi:PREDICTED: ABSCISIC ACID-INSENSITIVE 5-like protein 5 isoform X2 [Tarenaya hassleriana]|uniref:ABSCISIC ACID-INSENSITIVE 5-like protein 5 isoform X2 n=1 Tax=Tarenaya hassleriana TaxID=28532 RepID=UPI00053C2E08|nr:PREDICTED: ABSCISIC ACID-INSENSITIVE 5-like protein 5 isoform X2 [Tarenaya hassleriana]
MASNLNFKNFGYEPPGDSGGGGGGGGGNGGRNGPPASFPLTRQGSIYSLTFDEFQSSLGKDFGSMNMDELLKNIWSAEETQAMASTGAVGGGGGNGGRGQGGQDGLQRQGSLTLPRTLSQKRVDEVWKDISKEYTAVNNGGGGSNLPQRQQTLGEVTLEEFLVRAGVVREETQAAGKANKGGYFRDSSGSVGNTAVSGDGFAGLMGNLGPESGNQMSGQSSMLPVNVNGARSSNQHQEPKQPAFGYGTQMPLLGGQPNSHGIRGGLMGLTDRCLGGNAGLVQVQGPGLMTGGGLGLAGAVGIGGASPVTPLSTDGTGKSNGDTSSVSPLPYMFSGGMRGRKSSGAVEKVVERRQRRMIKNRESAARSRARKQAYTMELEAEIAKLKEENQELRKKQVTVHFYGHNCSGYYIHRRYVPSCFAGRDDGNAKESGDGDDESTRRSQETAEENANRALVKR